MRIRPNVKFKLFTGNTHELLYKLSVGTIDLAIVRGPVNSEQFDVYSFPVESWMALINTDNPLSAIEGDTLDCALLNDQNVIVPSRNALENQMRAEFSNISIDVNIVCSYNNVSVALGMASAGVGIAIVPAMLASVAEHFPQVVVKKLVNPEISSYSAIVTEKDRQIPEHIEAFIQLVKTI